MSSTAQSPTEADMGELFARLDEFDVELAQAEEGLAESATQWADGKRKLEEVDAEAAELEAGMRKQLAKVEDLYDRAIGWPPEDYPELAERLTQILAELPPILAEQRQALEEICQSRVRIAKRKADTEQRLRAVAKMRTQVAGQRLDVRRLRARVVGDLTRADVQPRGARQRAPGRRRARTGTSASSKDPPSPSPELNPRLPDLVGPDGVEAVA